MRSLETRGGEWSEPPRAPAGRLARERQLWRIAVEQLRFGTAGHALFRCEQTFQGVALEGRDVLEIGAGAGLHSAFAAVRGARRVVALEPEADGSTAGARSVIRTLQEALHLENLQVLPDTIQSFENAGRGFDVALLYNSINHLDEESCAQLHRSDDARRRYRALVRHIASMLNPGALLVLADCSRLNLWPLLGVRNPFVPSIEWHKHQPPRVWVSLLTEEQFLPVSLNWYRYYPLRSLGRMASNAAASFVLASHFRLVHRYAPRGASSGGGQA